MGAKKTVSFRDFIHTRLRARSFSYCENTFDFSQAGSVKEGVERFGDFFLMFKHFISPPALTGECWRLLEWKIWNLWGMQAGPGSPESPLLSTVNPSFNLAMSCSEMS